MGPGGAGASYVYQEFKSETLSYPVSIKVGTQGDAASAFGPIVTPYLYGSYAGGGIMTPEGVMQTAGNAGNGGRGAVYVDATETQSAYITHGTGGGGNALAAGGYYFGDGAGGGGGNAPSDKVATAGGGGGAGGGYWGNLINNRDLRGGPGGWPGGGGGGGGYWRSGIAGQIHRHAPGAGATGAVFVTVRG